MSKMTPEQQLAWAKGKLTISIFLKDAAGVRAAWEVLRANHQLTVNRKPDTAWRNSLAN